MKTELINAGIKGVQLKKVANVGEIMPAHYQVVIGGQEIVCMIYTTNGCQSYNVITMANKQVKVASIETLLYFLLAFTYVDLEYYNRDTIMCMASYIFDVQYHNRLEQKGLLKRFSLTCYGKQETKATIFAEKGKKAKELTRGSAEWEEWFLNYNPATINAYNNTNNNDKNKNKRGTRKKKSAATANLKVIEQEEPEKEESSSAADEEYATPIHVSTPRHAQTVGLRRPPMSMTRRLIVKKKKGSKQQQHGYLRKFSKFFF